MSVRNATKIVNFDLKDHGIAVRRGSFLSYRVMKHPRTGEDRVFLGFNTGGDCSIVVEVDPKTGRCVQYDSEKGCAGPWDMEPTPDGKLLVTGVDGSVSELDPVRRTFTVVGRAKTWFWNICRGSDGKYYLGAYSPAKLFRFDQASGRMEDLGVIDAGEKMVRLLEADDDGFVYMMVGFQTAKAYAYEIATGRSQKILPEKEERTGLHAIGRGLDGRLYIRCVSGRCYRLECGKALPVPKSRFPGFQSPALSDGTPVRLVDPDGICVGTGRRARIVPVNYRGPGSNIFHLAAGPDQAIYASTIMPLYLLRYTPATRKLENLGRGGPDNGEIYSFGHAGGILYYATYAGGLLMRYDPRKPVRPGVTVAAGWKQPAEAVRPWTGNPKLIGNLGKGHCRPRAMHVDSRGRVWIGSEAEYGKRHGGLACYDTRVKRLDNNPVVIRDQGINALTSGPDARVIYGGSTIARGSSMDPVTKEAFVFAWDVGRRKLLWKATPTPGATGINNLHYLDGKLYGMATGNYAFFVLNPETRRVEEVIPSPWSGGRPESMCVGPDGCLYGLTWMCLYRWRPGGKPEAVMTCAGKDAAAYSGGSLFHRGAVIVGNRFYFSCGPNVMSVRLSFDRVTR